MKSVHILMLGVVRRGGLPCQHGQSVSMKRAGKCLFPVWEELNAFSELSHEDQG